MNINVPYSELQKKSLFIATPMYGGQCFGSYTQSILGLSQRLSQVGIAAQFSFLFNESLITRARNYLVDEFLRSDKTHLLFIDSDIQFDPEYVIALLAIDKPIIGAPYSKKCIAWENVYDAVRYGLVPNDKRHELTQFAGDFVFNMVPGTKSMNVFEPTEVLEIGTGFMMIERSVLERFAEAYPQYWFTPDHNRSAAFNGSRKVFQYFQAEIEPKYNRYLSEDYWFCQKAREAGMSVWFCPWMKLGHHGTYVYSGSIPAMATILNERINRNDPVPQTVYMDGPQPENTKQDKADILTVKKFFNESSGRRSDLFGAWARTANISGDELKAEYNKVRDEWLANDPDAPIATKITQLILTMKAQNAEPVEGDTPKE